MRITEIAGQQEDAVLMPGPTARSSSREEALRAIREHERFCLTTHERPDGDAVGSLAAMQLRPGGARARTRWRSCPRDEFPLPYEYRFIQLEGLTPSRPPTSASAR